MSDSSGQLKQTSRKTIYIEIDIVKFLLEVAQNFTQSGAMSKPISDFSFDHRVVRIVLNVT